MGSFRREILIALAVFVPIFVLVVVFRPVSKISFLNLRVVNDTHQSVRIQPCWDLVCLDTHGLPGAVIAAGRSVQEGGHFPTDRGGEVVVAIRKPGGKTWEFSSCMFKRFAPEQDTGVVRVSHARKCLPRPGG